MAETQIAVIPYPAHYESDVVLRDGSTLRLRPIRPGDAEGLLLLHDRLSLQSQRFRFFELAASRADEVSRLLQADHDNEFVLVAEAGNRLVGVATYIRDPRTMERAEVAFVIADALQGRGVGTRMLESLAGVARDHHIETFDAYVLVDNDRMIRVFTDSTSRLCWRTSPSPPALAWRCSPTQGDRPFWLRTRVKDTVCSWLPSAMRRFAGCA